MAVPSFLFGGSTNETPASIKQKRDLVRALMGASNSPKNIGEGLNALGDGIVANVLDRRATEAEAKGTATANDLFNSIIGGGASPVSSPSSPSATPSSGAPSSEAPPVDLNGNEVYNGFIDTVKTGVTNPYGLAAVAATGRAESGFSPKNVNRTWSDPSESGKPGTAGGIMSWRGPRYNALAATGDLSPAGQGKFFLQENPQLIKSLNDAKSVEEAQRLMNNAWAFRGYNRPGGEAARRLGYAQSFLPKFQGQGTNQEVASLDPSAGMPSAPAPGYVDPMISAPNYNPTAPNPRAIPTDGMHPARAPQASGYVDPTVSAPNSSTRAPMTMAAPGAKGLISPGNIDLANRPVVKNPDGSISTVRSMSFGQDGKEILVPTVSPDGRILSDQDAIDQYRKTGQNLGVFDSPDNATAYAQTLHNQQSGMYGPNSAAPPLDPPRTISAPPAVAQVAQQQAAPQSPQPGVFGGVDPRLLQALQNPFLNEGQKSAVQLLIQQQQRAAQQQQEQQTWQAREEYKRTAEHSDPGYQLEQDYKKAQLEAIRNKTGKTNLINAGEGNIYDPDSKTWIKAPSGQGQTGDAFRFGGNSVEAQALNGLIESKQITPGQAQQLGAGKTITDPSTGATMFLTPQGIFRQQGQSQQAPQSQEVDIFAEDGRPSAQPMAAAGQAAPAPSSQPSPQAPPNPAPSAAGASVSNPGIIPLTGGKPQKLLTESERRNQSLFSVVEPELKVVENNFDALTEPSNQIYSKMPFSEFVTTPQYQQAENSLQTIVSSYLYSMSGATATPEEVRKQTSILTPRPGEAKESVANKKMRIRTMVNAIAKAGSLPTMDEPTPTEPQAPAANGARPRAVNPQTREVIEFDGTNWVPVQ